MASGSALRWAPGWAQKPEANLAKPMEEASVAPSADLSVGLLAHELVQRSAEVSVVC